MAVPAETVEAGQIDPVERARDAIGGNPSPDTIAWFCEGLRACVMGQGTLEDCLGLAPEGPGKPPARRQLNRELRDSLIQTLVSDVHGGNVLAFLEALHRFETRVLPRWSGEEPPPGASEEEKILYLLSTEFDVPRSRSGIYAVL